MQLAPGVKMSEDCLNLNVFAPEAMPQHLVNGKLQDKTVPVIVLLDAMSGAGGTSTLSADQVAAGLGLAAPQPAAGIAVSNGVAVDGSRLAEQLDSIIVTLNYRVGPLGFFSSAEWRQQDGWGGNYGLLDQVAAMRWVRQNIAGFGGDPTSITLLGSGAAASLSLLHVSLASSVGLFRRVVALGSAVSRSESVLSVSQVHSAGSRFQVALNCNGAAESIRNCLRQTPVDTMISIGYSAPWAHAWGPSEDGVYLRTQNAQAVFSSPALLQASSSLLMLGAPSSSVDLALNFALNGPGAAADDSQGKTLSRAQVAAILGARFADWPGLANGVLAHYSALPSSIVPTLTNTTSRANVQWLAKVLSDGTVSCRHAAIASAAFQTNQDAPARGVNGASTPAYLLSMLFRIANAPGSYGSNGVAGTARSALVQDGCWESCKWSREAFDAGEASASALLQGALGALSQGAADDGSPIAAKQTFTTGAEQTLKWDAWSPNLATRLDLNVPQSQLAQVASATDVAQCAFWAASSFYS
jgi:hypothetical protein